MHTQAQMPSGNLELTVSRFLPIVLWLDAITRAQYSAFSECRSLTVIEAFLIPALAIVNTGVDYSNYRPTGTPNLVPQPLAALSLVPEAKLITDVEYAFNSKAKTIYHINGRVGWGIGAYNVTARGIKLLVAIEAKSPINWGMAQGELLLHMATIQNDRKAKGQRLTPIYGFCSDGDIYLFAILHENSKYQFSQPLRTASYRDRCTVFSNMVYIFEQAKATAANICGLPEWKLSNTPLPRRPLEVLLKQAHERRAPTHWHLLDHWNTRALIINADVGSNAEVGA